MDVNVDLDPTQSLLCSWTIASVYGHDSDYDSVYDYDYDYDQVQVQVHVQVRPDPIR